MSQRKYYSARKDPKQNILTLDPLKKIIFSAWEDFSERGYFQEHFGINCTDGNIPGKIGTNVEGYILRKIRKTNLWPLWKTYRGYSEEDLFDMIEFLFDHVSKPLEIDAYQHNWNDCGWHYKKFDSYIGQLEFVSEINQFLGDYRDGYELSVKGEILTLGPEVLKPILSAIIPKSGQDIREKMEYAGNKFRKYASTIKEREESVRDLADCLEYLRPQIKKVLNHKDEQDLFNIANNFAIRHFDQAQKTNYDKNVWLSWMFYFYYATLLTSLHLLNREKGKKFALSN